MICSTDLSSIIVHLAADVTTTANIPDNKVYPELTSSSSSLGLSSEIIKKVHFMVADPGYNDHELYESSLLKIGFQLVYPLYADTGKHLKKGLNLLISTNHR